MSYSEDRADSRSLTAVVLILLGIAVVGIILYFAVFKQAPVTDTVVVTPGAQNPQPPVIIQGPAGAAGAPGSPGASGADGAAGQQGADGAAGSSNTTGSTDEKTTTGF
jgi:hypothetical protein